MSINKRHCKNKKTKTKSNNDNDLHYNGLREENTENSRKKYHTNKWEIALQQAKSVARVSARHIK